MSLLVDYSHRLSGLIEYLQGVAPVSPCRLASGLLAGAALVGDEVRVESLGLEERVDCLDVVRLVVVGVT